MEDQNTRTIKKELKNKHISMLALSGSIGTGLFVASGGSITKAGPMGSILAYLFVGLMVYFLMIGLGEMATYLPTTGSFSTYATRFVDPAFGFAMGWNYWFNWIITVTVDIVTVGLVMEYWFPDINPMIFSGIAFLLVFLLNSFSVGFFGETEYWFSLIKVITIIFFLFVGILIIIGIIKSDTNTIANLTVGNHGFLNGWEGTVSIFVIAGFSFQGTELIGMTSGEAKDPKKAVPKAIREVFWRILIFYILSIFVIAAIIPYNDPNLLNSSETNIVYSPFTIVFQKAGILFAASLMNAVILTSILSSANSGVYASSRMLFSMAKDGFAPKFFGYLTKKGIPLASLVATIVISTLIFLVHIFGDNGAYILLVASSGLSGFIAWGGIALSYYRFRRAYKVQKLPVSELVFKDKFFPYGTIYALILVVFVFLTQDLESVVKFDIKQLAVSYLSVPIFVTLFLYYKIKHKTKLVSLEEIDLSKNE